MSIPTNSQAGQDYFVLSILKEKRNGYFLEIGANDPTAWSNNTFVLETHYGWKGLMVEYDASFEAAYKQYRPNSYYLIADARKIDYAGFLLEKQFPPYLDYLQIDLDVNNRSTLDTLELLDKTVFDNYKFATITFEHDIYTGNYFDTRQISREIFTKRGYVLVFPDVQVKFNNSYVMFEDWYVHPDLVDMGYVNKVRTVNSLRQEEIIERLKVNY